MSFLVPKKPQILYAPMLSSFGGGSARGFNPGGGGGGGPVYIARVGGNLADEKDFFPSTTNFMTRTWSHNGDNCDGGTINLSGSGQYQLYSISMGKRISATGNVPTITMKVYQGSSTASGAVIDTQNITYPAQTDTSNPYQCQELVFPTPVTLNRGTTYSVAYGMASPGLAVNSGAVDGPPDGARTSYSLSGGGTLTFGSISTYTDSAPFGSSNGTIFGGTGTGQLPVFGFIL